MRGLTAALVGPRRFLRIYSGPIAAGLDRVSFIIFCLSLGPGAPVFRVEGSPVSVRVQRTTPGATLTPSKLIVLNAAPREQIEISNIEEVSRPLLTESMAGALDAAFFGTQAAGA